VEKIFHAGMSKFRRVLSLGYCGVNIPFRALSVNIYGEGLTTGVREALTGLFVKMRRLCLPERHSANPSKSMYLQGCKIKPEKPP
jgi:hypothetical protein